MSAIQFPDLRTNNAEQFADGLANVSYYLTFGRVRAWSNDSAPQQANTMPTTFYEVWDRMIGAKKLTSNDVRFVVPKNKWSANTIYTQYDDQNPNLFLSNIKFWVVTSNNSIYKCLGNSYGANSTVEPTAINPTNITQTSDGYIWKYLYTLTSNELLRFTTDNYIPIKTLTLDDGSQQWQVQNNAVEGAIYNMVITNSGAGYSNVSNISITISGDGSDAAATVGINNVSNVVNSVSMTNPGFGYSYATVSISGGGGSSGALRAIISPQEGHGTNPLYELGQTSVMLNPRINNSEGGILSVANEFRQISLLKDPLDKNGNVSANSVVSQSYQLVVVGTGVNYINDEIVYQGTSLANSTFNGTVLEYDTSNSIVKIINTTGTPTSQTLVGANSTGSKFVSSITAPDLTPFTGRLLYVDNIKPIIRSASQTESFQIIFNY